MFKQVNVLLSGNGESWVLLQQHTFFSTGGRKHNVFLQCLVLGNVRMPQSIRRKQLITQRQRIKIIAFYS